MSQQKQQREQRNIPESLTNFDALPDTANVRLPTVELLMGCSKATVWRMTRDGRLPQPKRRGRITAWNVGELRRALAA